LIGVTPQIDRGLGGISLAMLMAARHNILLQGPKAWTDTLLLRLQPHFRPLIRRNGSGVAFQLIAGDVGALILQDVDLLSAAEQTRVLAWMAGATRHTKVVSSSVRPLFPLVARGLFDDRLYYRLNEVLLQVDGT
jgi:Sigma-54 interaction domain